MVLGNGAKRFLVFGGLFLMALMISGLYGTIHNQLSFSVSEEYFTKFKFQQFGVEELALPNRSKVGAIGFAASWWMGVPIALVVGGFGFLHHDPRSMFIRSLKSFGVVALVALLVGLTGLAYGWFLASDDPSHYKGWFIPDDLERPRSFFATGHMHNSSYLGGLLGLIAGSFHQFRQRGDPRG